MFIKLVQHIDNILTVDAMNILIVTFSYNQLQRYHVTWLLKSQHSGRPVCSAPCGQLKG